HSLKKLYEALQALVGEDDKIEEDCLRLDKYYTATRYPDVWESGTPEEYFSESEAMEAIDRAKNVLHWVKRRWESLKKEG
ncbi:MAG: HEPN domain-containing protein, partial [Candidatus Caldarchaeum sp.]